MSAAVCERSLNLALYLSMTGGFDRLYVLKASPCPNAVASFFLYSVLAGLVYFFVVAIPVTYGTTLYESSVERQQNQNVSFPENKYAGVPDIRDVSRLTRVFLLLCCMLYMLQLLYILIFPLFLFNAVFSAPRGASSSSIGQFYSHSVNWGPVSQGVTIVLLVVYVLRIVTVLAAFVPSIWPILFLFENLFT
jgi:hypothetical protein